MLRTNFKVNATCDTNGNSIPQNHNKPIDIKKIDYSPWNIAIQNPIENTG